MDHVNVYEAKTKLSELIDRAAAGEEIIIARHGRPVARLVSYQPRIGKRRKLGLLAGKVRMARNFDAPLPDEVLATFAPKVIEAADTVSVRIGYRSKATY